MIRLRLNNLLKGINADPASLDSLTLSAKLCRTNYAMAQAYYFKMDNRDFRQSWEDDVHILDSALFYLEKGIRTCDEWGSKVHKNNLNFKLFQSYRRERDYDSVLGSDPLSG